MTNEQLLQLIQICFERMQTEIERMTGQRNIIPLWEQALAELERRKANELAKLNANDFEGFSS